MKGSWNSMSIIHVTLSFFFVSIYTFEDSLGASVRHLCRSDQRDTLLEFKNEFEIGEPSFFCVEVNAGEPRPKTKSWTNNSDCCNWEGITCSAKSGEVIGLDLRCSCLHGRFHSNSSLQNLHFLTTLDLSLNDISGHILFSVGKLSHLTSLNLSYNQFFGQIPPLIGNLSHLTSLDFNSNQFTGLIPSTLGNLYQLTSLDLSYNHFVGQIPSSFGNLSHLTSLHLVNNSFSGQIPFLFRNLFQLTSLKINSNKFFGQIPSSIGNLSQLTSLHFSRNDFSGPILSSIVNLYKLTSLRLSENNFGGEIPSSFGNLNQLTRLRVSSNNLCGKIPITLLNLTQLSYLSLSTNNFTGMLPPNFTSLFNLMSFDAYNNAISGTLPSSLFNIPSLTGIDLTDNELSGTLEFGNISLPSKLQTLVLGNNNFLGPLPKSISKFTNLYLFELSYFNSPGPVDFSIFSHLKSLRHLLLRHLNTSSAINLNDILSYFKELYSLDLSGSHVSVTKMNSVFHPPFQSIINFQLSGCGITELPEIIRTQKYMELLDISNNNIKGQVPGWLWMLPDLEYVDLSNNTFTGFENPTKDGSSSAPKSSITYFFGSNNNFTSKIPSFICGLRSLSILDLSYNNFNGSIPRCMGNLKRTLSVLNLHHNRLHGGLPKNIFKSLRSLDVGHNQLTGKLPRSLIHFSTLEVLNVESNKINDMFPFWLSSLQMLQVLVLRSNAFHGPLNPVSSPKLRIIDISHNHFNGTLSLDYFVKWSAMSSIGTNEARSYKKYMGEEPPILYYYNSIVLMNRGVETPLERILKIYTAVDFSGNNLEGEIPKSIGLLKELHVLNLSNNAFTGQIPSSMGNLTALESLDVSRNQLSGEIPQELGSLTFLAYMNFSHNQLSGLVPGGTQFRRQPCSSFENNTRLFGPSLDEDCKDIHTLRSEPSEMPEPEEEDEEVMSWIATAIGFIPGIAFGITLGYIFVSYKPEWFMHFGFARNKRRIGNSTAQQRGF